MTASIFAGDSEAYHKVGSGYRVVTGIEEMASVRRLPTMQANLLVVVVRSSLRGSDRNDSGRLECEGLSIGMSEVQAVVSLEVKFVQRDHVVVQTLENIVENIEEVIVAVNVAVILRTQLPT